MKSRSPSPLIPYLCVHCRRDNDRYENMFMVEEDFGHLFCSEECIVDFYRPLVEVYNRQENHLRKENQLTSEPSLQVMRKMQLTQEVLESPDEIWVTTRAHCETIYNLISRLRINNQDYFLVTCCLAFKGRPAFVVHQTLTQEAKILSFYRQGPQANELKRDFTETESAPAAETDGQIRLELSPEEFEGLEQKKSEMLAELLQARATADIQIEQFGTYECYLSETIQSPDEVYTYKDRDGDEIYVHLKSFAQNQQSFFYLALCQTAVMEEGQGENLMIPIMSFPTIDPNLAKHYRRGEKIQGPLKN